MKIADVKIGETYLTRVSGTLVKVVAVARIEPTGLFSKTTRFRVRRVDNGKTLDKTRAASALRHIPSQDPVTAKLLESVKAAQRFEDGGWWALAASEWDAVKALAVEHHRPRAEAMAEAKAKAARAKLGASSADPETAK